MAHRRSNRSVQAKIQNLRWIGGRQSFNAVSAGSSAQTHITAAAETDTVMRTRGEVYGYIDGVAAPGELFEVAIGLIVMPAGQGSTVVLAPITDPDAPWYYYTRFTLGYEEAVVDVVDVPGITSFRAVIDSKAMRILRPEQEVQIVMENATIQSAGAVNCGISTRVLLGAH